MCRPIVLVLPKNSNRLDVGGGQYIERHSNRIDPKPRRYGLGSYADLDQFADYFISWPSSQANLLEMQFARRHGLYELKALFRVKIQMKAEVGIRHGWRLGGWC